MELLDTPNPNAKKIVLDDNNNLNDQSLKSDISDDLYKIDGVDSVFLDLVLSLSQKVKLQTGSQ